MRRTIVRLFIAAALMAVMSGCRKESSDMPLSLNEKEYYSDSQLASITADGDSACFIGNEKGDIYRYDKRTGKIYDTLRTGADRIYDVAVRKGDDGTCFFVGVRNSGLMMYRYVSGRLVPERTFFINGIHDRYSPYKTIVCGDRIYVATSHGLFYNDLLSEYSGNELKRLFPTPEDGRMLPFLTTSLIKNGRYIYAASESGLVRCDVATNRIDVLHRGKKIKSAMLVNGNIHSLSEKSLYIDSNDGSRHEEYDVNVAADIYYHAGDTHYFISSDRVAVARDRDLEKGKGYKTIPLRRNVRPDCRNVIMADSITGHSLLVTENALFRIPFHLDVFNTDGKTTAACSGDGSIYFVTNNSLFRLNGNGSDAKRIADLPKTDRITSAMFHNGVLYYTNGNTELKRKAVDMSFIYNRLSGNPATIYTTPRGITAAGIGSDGSLYIGIRDSLLLLRGERAEIVKTLGYPFVQRIAVNGKDNKTYAALLNGGVIHLHGNKSSVEGSSSRHHFIKDIAFAACSANPCILTNHYLFSPDGKDSVAADGFSRLLTADGKTFYALMENGIRRYIIGRRGIRHIGDTLCDIRFSPSISLVHGSSVYVGATSLGIMEMKPDGTSRWIRFNHDVYTPDYKTIVFFFVLICLSAGFALWHRKRKRKDFGIFSEWEKVRKDIVRINPGQAKKLETESLDGIDTVDRRLADGRAWLERYETVKNKAAAFRQLTGLEVFGCIFERGIHKNIYLLDCNIGSRRFDIAECEKSCNDIGNVIMRADICKVLEAICKRYKENEETVNDIDNEFAARFNEFVNECTSPCGSVECALARISAANSKLLLTKAAGCIARIREEIKHVKPLVDELNRKEETKKGTREERKRIKDSSDIIIVNIKELYYILSQDTLLAGKIKIKQHIRKEDISLLNRQKVLMLLIAVPDVKSEIAYHLFGNASLGNIRSTLSKVKKDIAGVKENAGPEISAQKDSLGKYILRIVDRKR